MAQFDLTGLDGVKAWLKIDPTDVSRDVELARLITQASRAILSAINRSTILPTTFTEVRDGQSGDAMVLANYPVISVSSLAIGGVSIPPSGPLSTIGMQAGYILELSGDPAPPGSMQQLFLNGYIFPRGRQNVTVTYTAGYQVTDASVVPSSAPYDVPAIAPYGDWMVDRGVTFTATGVALMPGVGALSTGQYSVAGGDYTFAAADAGKSVSISYGYVPADLAQACAELVGERLAYSAHPGLTSYRAGDTEEKYIVQQLIKRVAGANITPWLAGVLQQYTRVVPI